MRRKVAELYGSDTLYQGGLKIYTTIDWTIQTAAQEALRKGLRVVDKRQGFRGPLKLLVREQWRDFADQIHQEVTDQEKHAFFIPPPPEALHQLTPLRPGKLYQAVVTAVNADRSLEILAGHVKGIINKEDRKWVWKQVQPGWVVWVQLKEGHSPAPGIVVPFQLDQEPKVEGALYSMDPITGEVKAIVGGYDFQRSEFNRATQALRQLGSAFKPVMYAAALDKGYTPRTTITDAPVTFQVGERSFWSPQNYGRKFKGPMDFASALKHSVNIIAVKIFHDIGIHYAMAFGHKLGIKQIKPYLSS